jgi:hypothetical protein
MAWLFARMVLKARVSGVACELLALALQDMQSIIVLAEVRVVDVVEVVERLLSGACLHSFALYTMFVTNVCQRVSAR